MICAEIILEWVQGFIGCPLRYIYFLCRYYPSDEFHLGVPYVLLKRDLSHPEGGVRDNKEAIHAKMAFEGNNNEEINIKSM